MRGKVRESAEKGGNRWRQTCAGVAEHIAELLDLCVVSIDLPTLRLG